MGTQGEHPKDPHKGDCGMAWFMGVEREAVPLGFQCLNSLSPAMGKIQLCPQQGQDKSQCPELLLDVKA